MEGNLFRDRFVSLQRRAIIEPRAPVVCVAIKKLLCCLLELIFSQRKEAETEGQGDRKARVQALYIGFVYDTAGAILIYLDALDVPFSSGFCTALLRLCLMRQHIHVNGGPISRRVFRPSTSDTSNFANMTS